MADKLKITIGENSYSISATLVADNKAKAQAKGAMDPMITAYSIVYGEIFDEAMSDEKILVNWLQANMNWSDISENVIVEKGSLVSDSSLKGASVELV